MKLLPEDKKFAILIKERDNCTCQRCGKQYHPDDKGKLSRGIQCSHLWSRRHWATRFDLENCDTLCFGCHSLWEHDKQGEYRNFKIKQLGIDKYEALEKKARSIKKKRIALQEFNKSLEELWI